MGTGELSGKPDEMLGLTCDGLASQPGGVAILVVSVTETGISSGSNGPLGSKNLTFQNLSEDLGNTCTSNVAVKYLIESIHDAFRLFRHSSLYAPSDHLFHILVFIAF